jgi:hypothetical protein
MNKMKRAFIIIYKAPLNLIQRNRINYKNLNTISTHTKSHNQFHVLAIF